MSKYFRMIPWISLFMIFGWLLLFFQVESLIRFNYESHYSDVLESRPDVFYKYYYPPERTQLRINITKGVLMVLMQGTVLLGYAHIKLWKNKQRSTLNKAVSRQVFILRFFSWIVLLLCLPFLGFGFNLENGIQTTYDGFALGWIMFVCVNGISLIPFLAQSGVVKILKPKDVLIFNSWIFLGGGLFYLLDKAGIHMINPYIAGPVVAGLPFYKNATDTFKAYDRYLDFNF